MRMLRLKLKAPLQSWGEFSRWDHRDTADMPTKSGIIGMLGCCLGYPRGDARLMQLSGRLHMAARADEPGQLMTDFHTVQGTDGVLLNAAGKSRGKSGTILTPRQYLQDAAFTVWLWGEEQTLEQCHAAMLHPVWPPFLGRKSCVPSVPLLPEWVEAESIDEAIRTFQGRLPRKNAAYEIEMLSGECAEDEERTVERRDEVIRADLNRYQRRSVRAGFIRREDMHVSE